MRVLLLNGKRNDLFLSLSTTVKMHGDRTFGIPLGLITVAALLPRDWELKLVDLNIRAPRADEWDWAQAVFVSGMMAQKQSLLQVVSQAKQAGKISVAGGPYPNSLPQELIEAGCDFVVKGEAEGIMSQVVRDIEAGLPGGIYQAETPPDLSQSPLPRFDLLDKNDYTVACIQTARGCPYDCEFCDVVNLNGRKLRFKSGAQVLRELTELYRLGWRNQVFIADDNLVGNHDRALKLVNEIDRWLDENGRPFYFWFQGSLDLAKDRELIDALTQANFAFILVGVESTDQNALEKAGKTTVLKSSPVEDLISLNRNGLTVMASFIIGLDEEPDNVAQQIMDLVDRAKIPLGHFSILHAYPGTKLWARLEREGRLFKDRPICEDDPEPINLRTQRPDEEILQDLLKLWSEFYGPRRFFDRARDSLLELRPTRKAMAEAAGRPVPQSTPPERKPWGYLLKDIKLFLRLLLNQGLLSPHRKLFLRNLIRVFRQNPSRWVRYIMISAIGVHMYSHQQHIRSRIQKVLELSR